MKCLLTSSIVTVALTLIGLESTPAFASSVELALQLAHHAQINSIVFTPSGRQLVTGGLDKTAILWDVESGRTIRRFKHGDGIGWVDVSPDGKKLITAGDSIVIWDLATGKELTRVTSVRGVRKAFFLGDGRTVLAAGEGRVARIDIRSRTQQILSATPHSLSVFAISKDGERLAFQDEHLVLRLWDTKKDRQIVSFDVKPVRYHSAAFSSDAKRVIVGGAESALVQILDATSGHEIRRLDGAESWASVAFVLADKVAVAGSAGGGEVYAWNTDTGKLLWTRDGYPHTMVDVTVDPSGAKIGIAYAIGVQTVDLRTGELTRNFDNPYAAVAAVAFRPNHRQFLSSGRNNEATLWDLASGRPEKQFAGHADGPLREGITSVAFSPDGTKLLTGAGDSTARLWDVDRGQVIFTLEHRDTVTSVAFSPDGRLILTGSDDRTARLWDSATGSHVVEFNGNAGLVTAVAFSRQGSQVFTGGSDAAVWRWDASTGKRLSEYLGLSRVQPVNFNENLGTKTRSYERRLGEVLSLAVSPDGNSLVAGSKDGVAILWDIRSGKILQRLNCDSAVAAVSFTVDSQMVVTGSADSHVRFWSVDTGKEVRRFDGHSDTSSSVAVDGPLLMTGSRDGTSAMWSISTGKRLATFAVRSEGDWLIVSEDGRFDTNMVGDDAPLSWIVSDQTFRPLPPEIFMRDYYEPRLLPRLLECLQRQKELSSACDREFQHIRPLGQLDRLQPRVTIDSVLAGPTADTVRVRVTAVGAEDKSQPNGKTRTDAYDLRLFRDGQLVGRWPEVPEGGDELAAWRRRTHVPHGAHEFVVALPTGQAGKAVSFTAYAFNEDRVKSATALGSYTVLPGVRPRPRRAYVVTIGVDAYDAPQRTLHFAVSDAQAMTEALSHLEGYEMVAVSLTSQRRDARAWQATKANIHAVLARLAGKPVPIGSLAGVKRAERLTKATPDDLVIVTFSGHGHTTPEGRFYLLASDSGTANVITPAALAHFVSSDELSEWLRPIDAGQMALIIDACHSAASVDQPGFKPGPMGDRGLGQLAYDKAMRILAASQADAVALESAKLKQGLLTYALVHDGLALGADGKRAADADHNGQLTLAEWLRWGEQHTPVLYADIQAGRRDAVYADRDGVIEPGLKARTITRAQTPALFDFARSAKSVADVVLR